MKVLLSGPPEAKAPPLPDTELLCRRAEQILKALDEEESELSLSLIDDAAMAELNASYREKVGPTDVLSFSLLEGEQADYRGDLLGDVVISVDTAQGQAAEQGVSLDDELARLLIHGVLHLLGHDHMEPEKAARMRAEEERLWKLLEL